MLAFTKNEYERIELRAKCLGSLLYHCQVFYPILTGNPFVMTNPAGRESHIVSLCRELTAVFYLKKRRLVINLPFGHFKTTILCLFVTWAYAHYPDCQFIFISYGVEPAIKGTYLIRRIMELKEYEFLFEVYLRKDSKAKDDFMTTRGGRCKAFGSDGPVTGFDAGMPFMDRFSGMVLYDDPHKAKSEGEGDAAIFRPTPMTEINTTNSMYASTVISRPRGENVPIVISGQRVRSGDLSDYVLSGGDGDTWESVILKALDENRNPLYPEAFPLERLERWEKFLPNFYAAQCQQAPNPPGGGLYKKEWMVMLDEDPEMLLTFITVDTAESAKDFADKTVFSFWGVYKIKEADAFTNMYGLHSIHGEELGLEPYELKDELMRFYGDCLRYKTPCRLIIIEKKSTGKTLWSVLDQMRGVEVIGVERTKASGGKEVRYEEQQQYFSRKLISFNEYSRHTKTYVDHLMNITLSGQERYRDICDTVYDAVKFTFIDGSFKDYLPREDDNFLSTLMNQSNQREYLQGRAYDVRQ